jgi:hypothetical protein
MNNQLPLQFTSQVSDTLAPEGPGARRSKGDWEEGGEGGWPWLPAASEALLSPHSQGTYLAYTTRI